jgi:hypothetical protein
VAGADQPWRRTGDGLVVRVRVTPRSSRERVWGIEATAEGPAVKVRVRAVPADGAANAAVAAVLADWLGVPNRTVTLAAGGKSRVKSFAVAGDPEALVALFKGKVAALAGKED